MFLQYKRQSFLGIRKGLDIKGLGLFSQSFFTLSETDSFEDSKMFFQLRGEKILDYLLDNSLIDDFGEHCWSGHYFETQGKTGSLSPKKPEIVSTTVCAEAFYKHYELTKSKKSLDVVKSVASFLKKYLIKVDSIHKVREGHPHIVDYIEGNKIQLIINTTQDTKSLKDSHSIRKAAIRYKVPYITTISAAKLAITSINVMINQKIQVKSLQEYYKE